MINPVPSAVSRAWFSPSFKRCSQPCTPPVRLSSVCLVLVHVQPSIRHSTFRGAPKNIRAYCSNSPLPSALNSNFCHSPCIQRELPHSTQSCHPTRHVSHCHQPQMRATRTSHQSGSRGGRVLAHCTGTGTGNWRLAVSSRPPRLNRPTPTHHAPPPPPLPHRPCQQPPRPPRQGPAAQPSKYLGIVRQARVLTRSAQPNQNNHHPSQSKC